MKSRTILALTAAAVILAGCSKEGQQEDGNGRLRITFSTDLSVGEMSTRAFTLAAPSEDQFSLQVTKDDGGYTNTWDNITDYPGEGLYLPVGSYTATARYGDVEQEGFGCEVFSVTKAFNVVNNVTTSVEMVARLANMAVTVEYTDAFKGYFPTHNAVISRAETEIVDFSDDPDGAAFIKPEAFTVTLDHTNQNGKAGSSEFEVTDKIGAATHLSINVDVPNVGDGLIVITFNDDVEVIEVPIEVGDE